MHQIHHSCFMFDTTRNLCFVEEGKVKRTLLACAWKALSEASISLRNFLHKSWDEREEPISANDWWWIGTNFTTHADARAIKYSSNAEKNDFVEQTSKENELSVGRCPKKFQNTLRSTYIVSALSKHSQPFLFRFNFNASWPFWS